MELIKKLSVLIFILGSAAVQAQRGLNYTVGLANLHSTHGNNFPAARFAIEKKISTPISIGMGIEYSYAPKHLDNDWQLKNLNFLPVYLLEKFTFNPRSSTNIYLHLAEGISFMQYDKFIPATGMEKEKKQETGFYGYAGLGAQKKLTSRNSMNLELGIKGYKISTNNLDVNPHGINFSLGFTF
jgi:Outer membrane protein beta-barrel domain